MITITGELRKILDSGYTNKATGERISQFALIIEPAHARQNFEVFLSPAQSRNVELVKRWQALKGQVVSVAVNLFVNYEHRFHKFNAQGSAEPLPVKE